MQEQPAVVPIVKPIVAELVIPAKDLPMELWRPLLVETVKLSHAAGVCSLMSSEHTDHCRVLL